MKTTITLLTLALCLSFVGCSTSAVRTQSEATEAPELGSPAAPFIETETGEIKPNPVFTENVSQIGNIASDFGVPFAGMAGELASLLLAAGGLILNEKLKREKKAKEEERKAKETLVKSIEKSNQPVVKSVVSSLSRIDGTSATIDAAINKLT